MTDTALSSLFPIHQIGSDGFNWWIGQIEQNHKKDPKRSGRCKVRIVGLHPQSCDAVHDDDLPWATTVMPISTPHGTWGVSSNLKSGHWVVGFFLDNDKQQPVIIGSVGKVANSKKTKLIDKETAGDGCNSFTSYTDPEKMNADQNLTTKTEVEFNPNEAGHVVTTGTEVVTEKNEVISSPVTVIVGKKYQQNSKNNAAGINFCVEKADKCGKEGDLKGNFNRLFSEMLYETQRNNGKLGTYLVGELSGGLFDAVDLGRDYVDKAIYLVRAFIAKVKGFVVKMIKKVSKKISDAILRPTKEGNSLTKLTKKINKQLDKVGCKMADLGDRLAAWLESVIFGYLFNIYKATACQLDKFISGLLNKIQSLMNDLLEDILGPLQAILGAIAKPINMIGDAINYVLNLLGIQCSGPKKKCAKTVVKCTDCSTGKKKDFLDELLEDLENWDGEDWNQYTCDDAQEGVKLKPTSIDFVGGHQKNPDRNIIYNIDDIKIKEGDDAVFTVTRSGLTDISSSVTYRTRDGSATKGEDYQESDGVIGFHEGQTEKTVSIKTFADNTSEGREDFFIRLFIDTPREDAQKSTFNRNIARCVITESNLSTGVTPVTPDDGIAVPETPSINYNPEADPFTGNTQNATETDDVEVTTPTYDVTSDKLTVKEGEFVTYTITTTNVPEGTVLEYQLFGSNISPSDIIGNNLLGQFIIEESQAKVIVGINKDNVIEDDETLIFAVTGTGASASVLITSDTANLSEEEINEIEDQSSNDIQDFPPSVPTAGNPVTDKGGGIIQVPILTPGTAYTEPPKVFITGEGYGASGEVLLDSNGFASEIRIIDPGFGYKINLPTTEKVECVIDSFTMIRPGQKYTSTPTVFVDGDSNVAEAIINTKGQIVSVRIKNRTITYDSYPEIKILGGGGYGAKFIPSFSCLSPEARVKVGSAKVGTGSYIDCP